MFRQMYENDQIRYYEGPIILGIVNKLETYPAAITFTEQENRRIQVEMEAGQELLTPYPYPYDPLTFRQPTQQIEILSCILFKLKDSNESC